VIEMLGVEPLDLDDDDDFDADELVREDKNDELAAAAAAGLSIASF
jgi:hypothetical protein